jgi:hypothetical protein
MWDKRLVHTGERGRECQSAANDAATEVMRNLFGQGKKERKEGRKEIRKRDDTHHNTRPNILSYHI